MVGLPALRALLDDQALEALSRAAAPLPLRSPPPPSSLIDEIATTGRGLVMVMVKGGVGRTTIAASIAAALASRGYQVHLSTTDPAAHVAATIDGQLENLTVSRIDPAAETKAYVDRVMATRGANLEEADKALLAEDLRSPCYEEVAVFAAFSRRHRNHARLPGRRSRAARRTATVSAFPVPEPADRRPTRPPGMDLHLPQVLGDQEEGGGASEAATVCPTSTFRDTTIPSFNVSRIARRRHGRCHRLGAAARPRTTRPRLSRAPCAHGSH
jgi:hypothetical protein